jgi:hypothetical protein
MVSKSKYNEKFFFQFIFHTCESVKKANKVCKDFNNSLFDDNVSQLSTHCRNLKIQKIFKKKSHKKEFLYFVQAYKACIIAFK